MKKIDFNPETDPLEDPMLPRRERREAKRRRIGTPSSLEHALRADSRIQMWLVDSLDFKAAQILTKLQSLPSLARMAVMPDVHPSADVCVGTVLGTDEVVYPQAIGGDIGCGMSTLAMTDVAVPGHAERAEILRELSRSIDIVMRRRGQDAAPPRFIAPDASDLADASLRKLASGEGVTQLGSLGRGNHFVEVQHDEAGRVWIMVHSGSRFMGQAIARHYTREAQRDGVRASLTGLRASSVAGTDYLHDQAWGVAYARANRMLLLAVAAKAVASALGGRPDWAGVLDAPHNFIREESHDSKPLIVHRKGAAPAHAGFTGLIPGSAGTMSVHVEGRGEARSMASSSHGAGRVFSRSEAKSLVTADDLHQQMAGVAFDTTKSRSLRDEAPAVYRDLREVMEAQRDLVRVTRTLKPIVSFKAGG
ncbi:MAG: RtcB family protein [Tepidisphaera sp.]